MRKTFDVSSTFGSALDVRSGSMQRRLKCFHWLSDQSQLPGPVWLPRKMPFMILGVIAGLAEMTIIEAKRTSLTHPGFRRALIQL